MASRWIRLVMTRVATGSVTLAKQLFLFFFKASMIHQKLEKELVPSMVPWISMLHQGSPVALVSWFHG